MAGADYLTDERKLAVPTILNLNNTVLLALLKIFAVYFILFWPLTYHYSDKGSLPPEWSAMGKDLIMTKNKSYLIIIAIFNAHLNQELLLQLV